MLIIMMTGVVEVVHGGHGMVLIVKLSWRLDESWRQYNHAVRLLPEKGQIPQLWNCEDYFKTKG